SGARAGSSLFVIVSNVSPGQMLLKEIADSGWNDDVTLVWPDSPQSIPGLPPPWRDVAEAIKWCSETASLVPFSRLLPETMVWKLAAMIQFAAAGGAPTGSEPHVFDVNGLSNFFEQL